MADVLLCSADREDLRFVVSALEQVGHSVTVESSSASSLSALALSRYDAVVIDLASWELAEGELLAAARTLQSRSHPGLLVLGIAAQRLPKLTPQSPIIIVSAPFTPSQIVD